MAQYKGPQVSRETTLQDLLEMFAILVKDLQFILNGHLNANNIQANSIETKNLTAGAVTAEKIDVDQLSAISANLGHITAGLIEAITMIGSVITGSLIQTRGAGVYPRIEMSSSDNLLTAEYSAGNRLFITPVFDNNPGIRFTNANVTGLMANTSNTLLINTVFGSGNIQLSSGQSLQLYADSAVRFQSWAKMLNDSTGENLQQSLNQKANASTFTGSIPPGMTVHVVGGVVQGYT